MKGNCIDTWVFSSHIEGWQQNVYFLNTVYASGNISFPSEQSVKIIFPFDIQSHCKSSISIEKLHTISLMRIPILPINKLSKKYSKTNTQRVSIQIMNNI